MVVDASALYAAVVDPTCPAGPAVDRIWALHENLTAYDAAYVALAERLGEPLVTADGRIARAPGIRCEVRVLELA